LFRGVNAISLDTKGRISFPVRYRERLQACCEGKLVITIDTDRCLLVYPLPVWEELEQTLAGLPNLNAQARRLQRMLIGHATECELDGHNRILLPAPLREFAVIEKHVVLIGQGQKFELWDERLWTDNREKWLIAGEGDKPLSSELESLSL
jgi:MraZ protein